VRACPAEKRETRRSFSLCGGVFCGGDAGFAWGRKLFDAVFGSGDHRELYNTLVDSAAPRLRTIGTADLDVLRLPWELMADSRGPLTRRGVTIRRQLETARRPET